MSLRARIFIIVGIVVLIITAVVILLVRNIQQRQALEVQPTPTTTNGLTVIDSSNFSTSSLSTTVPPNVDTATRVVTDPIELTKLSVRQFARVFVERYTTYSSDNSFQNVHDVEGMVTKNLLNYLMSKPSVSTTASQPFTGVTTKVITTEIGDWSDSAASVKVQTMRTEQRGSTTSTTQESGKVKLVKQGDQWLVDGIYWDK